MCIVSGTQGTPRRTWFTVIGSSSERFSLLLDLISDVTLRGVDCEASVLLVALTCLGRLVSCRRVGDSDNREASGVHASVHV